MPPIPDILRHVLVFVVAFAGFVWAYVSAVRARQRTNPFKAFLAAYRRGDYAAALATTEGMRKAGRERSYWNLRGGALMQLGRLREAEESLNQAVGMAQSSEFHLHGRGIRSASVAMEKEIKLSALHQSSLGGLYLEQGRYNQALRCFEASLEDWPGHGPFHAHMAETLLRRGDPPAAALKWAKLAVEEDRAGKDVLPEAYHMNLCEDLGTLAWVTAVAAQDRAQVDRLVDEAIKLTARLSVPSSAQAHFQCGLAYEALGDSEHALAYVKDAIRIDPQGRWGRAARAKAAELGR